MDCPKILIIEADRPLAEAMSAILEREGFEVRLAHDGLIGLRTAEVTSPSVIVLDLELPVMSGLDVFQALRAGLKTRLVPIVMVAASADERDEILGLAMGSDDYVIKPIRMKVLVERVRRLVVRRRAQQEPLESTIIESRGVVIDRRRHQISYRGQDLVLTPSEYRLLETMLRQPGRAFSRNELIEVALGENTVVLDRTIDVHIKALRRKLGKAGELIETVRNIGYRFRSP